MIDGCRNYRVRCAHDIPQLRKTIWVKMEQSVFAEEKADICLKTIRANW